VNHSRVELLKKFIDEDPADPFNYYALALEYLDSNPSSARELFDQLLIHHPDYLPVYYTAGKLYADLGNEAKAQNILSTGIELAKSKLDVKALRELQSALLNLE